MSHAEKLAAMNILHSQLTRSVARLDEGDKIIPWSALDAIGGKVVEARLAYADAFAAHGTDAQALRRHLRELCKSVHALADLVEGLEEGLGR